MNAMYLKLIWCSKWSTETLILLGRRQDQLLYQDISVLLRLRAMKKVKPNSDEKAPVGGTDYSAMQ